MRDGAPTLWPKEQDWLLVLEKNVQSDYKTSSDQSEGLHHVIYLKCRNLQGCLPSGGEDLLHDNQLLLHLLLYTCSRGSDILYNY